LLALLGVPCVLLAGCGGRSSSAEAFRVGTDESCLVHQTQSPTKEYRGGSTSDPALELRFLGYLTAHGTQRFCDGKGPNSNDKQWGVLYAQLTTNRAKVTSLL
jgi:hypothetical protein